MSDQDLVFRILVLGLFIGARYVRWHARHLVGWQTSWPAMKKHPWDTAVLLSLAIAWLAAVVIYVAFPNLVARFAAPVPPTIRWCALAVAITGLLLLWWADHCLGQNLSVSLRIRDQHTLITSVPYRWVRHPIYAATLVYAAALATITANWVLAAAIFGPMALLIMLRLGREEQMMIEAFGDEYRAYMRRTGRLLPTWRQS